MDDAKQQLVDKLKTASNILVTVSRNPSVDQLSSLLGLTLLLNKQGKHAAAVFSGEVPSTLEFLQPEETIEKNTDSLRDFIIALDKNKADKLRYKVEDDVVRIFITPYKTSISQADFEFSQGDFNVDLVVALGVQNQGDLDEAIVSHGRILHDATVASINTSAEGGLGTINWHNSDASSLSELVTDLGQALGEDQLDEQIATALLTGIVAETDRFSNDKTSSGTMSASATLMAAGANQQLVASKLEGGEAEDSDGGSGNIPLPSGDSPKPGNGEISIEHGEISETAGNEPPIIELPSPDDGEEESAISPEPSPGTSGASRLMTEPPTMGGTLTANSRQEGLDPSTDPIGLPTSEPPELLTRQPEPATPAPATPTPPPEPAIPDMTPPPPAWVPPAAPQPSQTLSDLEQSVRSPHAISQEAKQAAAPVDSGINEARDEVNKALNELTAADDSQPNPQAPPPVPPPMYQPPQEPQQS